MLIKNLDFKNIRTDINNDSTKNLSHFKSYKSVILS